MNEKRNITFFEVNSSYSHTMLSYGYLRAFTEKKVPSWQWSHVETTVNEEEDLNLARLLTSKPDIICATLYLFNHEFTLRILKKLKDILPSCRIFLGGPEFLGCNKAFLKKNPEIDAVIRGDESSFRILLANLENIRKWNEVPGLNFIKAGKYHDDGFAKFADNLDGIPSPYDKGYFTPGRPFYQLETSRGCSGKCSFCTSALSDGVTCFSLERIKDDLEKMHQLGIHEIRIVDRTFNENKKRALSLLMMFRQFPETRFHLEINPALVDDELLRELRLFGDKRLHIEAGIQSLCSKSLKSVKRFGAADKMLAGLKKLCALENAEIHTDLIAGLPGQKHKDVINDVKTLIAINPHEIQLENLKILPGTPISEKPPAGLVWNPLPPYEVLKTKDMSRKDLVETKHLSKMLDSFLNIPRLKNLFRFGFRGDRKFIEKFLSYLETNSDPTQKQHLDRRLLLIKEYADENDNMLSELAVFFWLASGYPPGKFNLEPEKIKNRIETDKNPGKLIYSSDAPIIPSRAIITSFSFNVGALWVDANATVKKKKHEYLFLTAHGNRVLKIRMIG